MPGIAGLLEGLRYVRSKGTEAILRKERQLIHQAARGLATLPGVEVFEAANPVDQAGVLSFRVQGKDCEEVGEQLGHRGIAVRAGLHCAPTAHQSAGTLETGTIRVSVSDFNTPVEIQRTVRVLFQLLSA